MKKKKNLLLIGINHEQQHQELILMDILNIFFKNPLKQQFIIKKKNLGLRKVLRFGKAKEQLILNMVQIQIIDSFTIMNLHVVIKF